MAAARETIKRHRLFKDVTYIFYNVPELQHIETCPGLAHHKLGKVVRAAQSRLCIAANDFANMQIAFGFLGGYSGKDEIRTARLWLCRKGNGA
jgi:hypothetical protein